jgi:hypothetical protein
LQPAKYIDLGNWLNWACMGMTFIVAKVMGLFGGNFPTDAGQQYALAMTSQLMAMASAFIVMILWQCISGGPAEDLSPIGEETGTIQRIKKKIAGMTRIKRGLTVDSGAADNVMPIAWIIGMIVSKSVGSIAGLMYVAANGSKIPNMGQTTLSFMTADGTWGKWIFQIAAINKPLVSVSKLVESGHKVIFDESGSYILHKATGDIIKMKKERGVFVVDAYVPKQQKPVKDSKSLFTRRG